MKMSSQFPTFANLPQESVPGTHRIGGWVDFGE